MWLHIANHGGNMAFPGWLTLPSYRDLATGRHWHFLFAWLLVLNGLVYFVVALVSRHLTRDLVPSLAELAPRHLMTELWQHLKLQFPHGEAARHYNTLQKIAYAGLVLVLAPLVILTGLTMSPGFDAIAPWLLDLFGGRQSARSLHFIAVCLILLFVVMHLGALLAVGVWNELRSMITGRYSIRVDD
jgi:thiosulfate reductase cytochrome b subunit